MERIAAADDRIVALSALFSRSEPTPSVTTTEPVIDPRVRIEAERARIFETAQDDGYAAGMKRAEDEINKRIEKAENAIASAHAAEGKRLQEANARLARLLSAVPEAVAENDAQLEAIVSEVAFAATLRVLGETATQRPLIADVCRQALDEYRQRPVVLRVAADEVEALVELVEDGAVRIAADAHLLAGQCRLETHKGLYDTSLEVRLEALMHGFLRALRTKAPAA
ncbi:MAG: FliH/SctL family protein [Lysobacter sp.]